MPYTYKELCDLLGAKYTNATNKKVEFLEELESYCEYERVDSKHFIITNIYDNPLPTLCNGYYYKTIIIPVKCSKEDYDYLMQCSKWAGDCWNKIVEADHSFHEQNDRWKMLKNDTWGCAKDLGRSFGHCILLCFGNYPSKVSITQ